MSCGHFIQLVFMDSSGHCNAVVDVQRTYTVWHAVLYIHARASAGTTVQLAALPLGLDSICSVHQACYMRIC
jgi:hypothetical protein